MQERCSSCGFSAEDYEGQFDRPWLASVVGERVRLMFEGLPAKSDLPQVGAANELAAELERLVLAEDLHDAVHRTQEAARASARYVLGSGYGDKATVAQLNSSKGGVPKLPLDEANVSWRGIAGDRHRERRHHGHAWQALCLWSTEVIEALSKEGHPIANGYAGENLTLAGLDWAAVRTGLRFETTSGLVFEITVPATPCKKNADWFAGRDFNRMDHCRHPGWSRWYASVLSPGTVTTGEELFVSAP